MTLAAGGLSDIDFSRLARWLAASGIAEGEVSDAGRLTGGTQNLLVRFQCGDQDLVLRRPPPTGAHSAKTVQREAIVLASLAESGVPHPRFRGASDDAAIAGGAFLVTDAVQGFNATVEMPGPAATDPAFRRTMGLSLLDGIAALSLIPIERGSLSKLGQTDGFLRRQVGRWAKQLEGYAQFSGWEGPSALGPVAAIGAWLDRHLPSDFRPGLMHGDYHIGNVMFRNQDGKLAAILDWELAALGDPLLDLARLLTVWPNERGETLLSLKVTPWQGFPVEQELVERYATRTGRSMSALPWFKVLACYKYAIILEGTYARAQAGLADRETGNRLHHSSLGLIRKAAAVAEVA